VVSGSDLERVAHDRRPAVGRGTQSDHLRAESSETIVTVAGLVAEGDANGHFLSRFWAIRSVNAITAPTCQDAANREFRLIFPSPLVMAAITLIRESANPQPIRCSKEMSLQRLVAFLVDHEWIGSGLSFPQALTSELTRISGARYCFLSLFVEQPEASAVNVSFSDNGQSVENFYYKLTGTPCEELFQSGKNVEVRGHLLRDYPEDISAQEMGMQSYFGVPARTMKGSLIGNLALCDTRPRDWEDYRLIMKLAGMISGLYLDSIANSELEKVIMQHDLQRREEQCEDILSNFSHELLTPLNAVLGFVQLLQTTDLDLVQADYAEGVKRACSELAERVNGFMQAGAGFEQSSEERAEIKSEADKLFASCSDRILEAKLRVNLQVPERMAVKLSPNRLTTVLKHLIDNAIKFNLPGGCLNLLARQTGAKEVAIEVSDRGIGIPKRFQGRIFDRFQRGSQANGAIPGFGLGLHTVREVVREAGGSICLESDGKSGSKFTVKLPAAED